MAGWIADEVVVFIRSDGTRCAGRIAIGQPVGGQIEATCAVVLDGLEPASVVRGVSTLQALLNGARILGHRLSDFTGSGGRVVFPSVGDDGREEDVPLTALFGLLLRDPDKHNGYWSGGPQG